MMAPDALAAAFAAQVAAWAEAAGADAAAIARVRAAARAVVEALEEGHTCLWPDATAPADWLASGVVGLAGAAGSQGHPLLLDAQGRLYLQRYFDYEQRLAQRLYRSLEPAALVDPDAAARAALQVAGLALAVPAAAAAPGRPAIDWQRVAVALALLRPLSVISGGPGTGKTSTVVRILAALLTVRPEARIALAAPTGKAATRLLAAVQARAGDWPAALRDRLPQQASTLHSLLGRGTGLQRFAHHGGRPLPLDVLVVDEASMLDLALAAHLFEALPTGARLILLGDKDQLAAVESGAVFAELSRSRRLSRPTCRALGALSGEDADALHAATQADSGGLVDSVVWFEQQYRFGADSAIGRCAAQIRAGAVEAVLDLLRQEAPQPASPGLVWLQPPAPGLPGAAVTSALWAALEGGFAAYFQCIDDHADAEQVFATFERFRVLCALREGPFGVRSCNARLAAHARARVLAPGESGEEAWYRGRPLMILRNDAQLGVFNGDVAIVLPDAEGELQACLPAAEGGLRWIPRVRLPLHETAYALTVHKSQGSEFDAVAVLLPAADSALLSRELLYTALTRARQHALLWGSAAAITAAVARSTRRASGLWDRLAEVKAALSGSSDDTDSQAVEPDTGTPLTRPGL